MDNSGMTAVLILIIFALVGGGVWYFTTHVDQKSEASLELTIPSGENN